MNKQYKIPFNTPLITGAEIKYIQEVINSGHFSGDGPFTLKCNRWLEDKIGCKKALLTTSCTHALEMASLLIDIQPGDEVIMPSFTFVSTSNPFVLRGARIIFIDIRPETMNLNEDLIEPAITSKTKAIIPMHYAGVSCNMDQIMKLAKKYNLWVIEDAAQCILAYDRKGRHIGSVGHISCFSFHETKNIHCGEGGAICINDENLIEKAEIIREKGTNRKKFLRGEVDKYTWVDKGSSYLPDELNAAFLWAQLQEAEIVTEKRKDIWLNYYAHLKSLEKEGLIKLPEYTELDQHNGHIFFFKLNDEKQRNLLIEQLKEFGITAVFHYIPLHLSLASKNFSKFNGNDIITSRDSNRLLRLPLYLQIHNKVEFIQSKIKNYLFKKIGQR